MPARRTPMLRTVPLAGGAIPGRAPLRPRSAARAALYVKPAEPAPYAIVSDYKTSKGAVDDLHKATKNEDDVQLPLYALAIERLTGVRVVALELYAASSRRRRQIVDAAHADAVRFRREGTEPTALPTEVFRALLDGAEAKASRLVAETRAAVASSLRREVADASVCSECAWRGVCRPDEARVVVARGAAEDVP